MSPPEAVDASDAAASALSIAISPAHSVHNSFINRFSAGIVAGGHRVVEFSWRPLQLARADVIILHWPNEFFTTTSAWGAFKANAKLRMLLAVRRLRNVKLVWVAHNARPHDQRISLPGLTHRFIDALDGVIYLSQFSSQTLRALYRFKRSVLELTTVHGHYRDDCVAAPRPIPPLQDSVRLVYFGQVRRYKNVDELVLCARELSPQRMQLTVAGLQQDATLAARIESLARGAEHIRLDVRNAPLSEAELEATIDAGHAVVLPYRDILNSGAALYALSRNRPVLAPRLGGLPELQAHVGAEWLYLYDGALSAAVLSAFVDWMHSRSRGAQPDLSAYDWSGISAQLCGFIRALVPTKAVHPDRHSHRSE